MPPSSYQQPTEVELQMLRILWELGPSPVRAIHAKLNALKGTNYSTTVKMLAVMKDKGLVTRDDSVSPHVYRALVSRKVAGKRMMRDLVEKVYEGATMQLVMQALSTGKASQEELDEVRRLIDALERRSNE